MISAIVAIAENGVIGKDGDMPWPRIEEDMKWFVETTTNHVVIMGRKTWDSIPADKKPLKNRINIVVTSQAPSKLKGAKGTLHGALHVGLDAEQRAYPDKEIFIIGGKEIYEQCFSVCDKIYITRVKGNYDGNVSLDLDTVLEDFHLSRIVQSTKKCKFETWERGKKDDTTRQSFWGKHLERFGRAQATIRGFYSRG